GKLTAQRSRVREPVVDFYVELVVAISVGSGADPVIEPVVRGRAHVEIGQREELHHLVRHRINCVAGSRGNGMKAGDLRIAWTLVRVQFVERNVILAIWAAVGSIVDAGVRVPNLAVVGGTPAVRVERSTLITTQLAEVSRAFFSTRHASVFCHGTAGAASLIIEEEKRLILPDWPADGGPEIVPAHGSNLHAGLIVKEIVSVELVVAKEIIRAAVEVVGAGARDEVDYGGSAEADFRAKVRLLYLKLLHGVHRRRVQRVDDHRVLLDTDSAHSVHQDVRGCIPSAVGDEIVGHIIRAECIPGRLGNPRS